MIVDLNVELIMHGRVQGVGFRNFVEMCANVIQLTGYVKNQSDGTVYARIQGSQAKIDEMLEKCYQGPIMSKVRKIDIRHGELEKYNGFEIRR